MAVEGEPTDDGLPPCGTTARYQRHVKAREPTCGACRAANTAYTNERRAADPAFRENAAAAGRARQAALRCLTERHADEFAGLMETARWKEGL